MYDDSEEVELIEAEHEAYAAIGYFLAQFSAVELVLTALLATISRNSDLEAFHVLTRGMDTKVKIERLRELCAAESLIPKNGALEKRLDLLQSKVLKLRNILSHSLITTPFEGLAILALRNISHIKEKDVTYGACVSADELYLFHEWCLNFFEDLLNLSSKARKREALAITHPRSLEPTEFHHRLDVLKQRAKNDMRRLENSKTLE